MDIVVGVTPDDSGEDAVALGAALARTFGARPVLTNVHLPAIDFPSRGNVDAEWDAFVLEQAHAAVRDAATLARERYGLSDVATHVTPHRSSGRGLAAVAETLGAALVVVGSAPGAMVGRIGQGSTSDQLLHGSPVPVALAPNGYRRAASERFSRLVAGYDRGPNADPALEAAARWAAELSLPLVVLTVVLRVTRIYGSRIGRDAEALVVDQLVRDAAAAQHTALDRLAATRPEVAAGAATTIVRGDSAVEALSRFDWADDDLLVLGSGSAGPLRRVFLGDMTHKLLRAAAVPTVVLPRD